MQYTISETAKLAGVSVRTLHYYDEIGLLSPSKVNSSNSYRFYDDAALAKLQQILFYRELDFQLKDIVRIMNASTYKKEDALYRQKELLKLKRTRLDKLIALIDMNLKGENNMSFEEFNTEEIEDAKRKYAHEVNEKWGNTAAYTESKEKTGKYTKEDWQRVMGKMDEVLKKLSKHINEDPGSAEVQILVDEWRSVITENYYNCTIEILSGLGEMYVMDERFKKNIDKFAVGTSELLNKAIKVYVKKH